jgi:hypothetical protein
MSVIATQGRLTLSVSDIDYPLNPNLKTSSNIGIMIEINSDGRIFTNPSWDKISAIRPHNIRCVLMSAVRRINKVFELSCLSYDWKKGYLLVSLPKGNDGLFYIVELVDGQIFYKKINKETMQIISNQYVFIKRDNGKLFGRYMDGIEDNVFGSYSSMCKYIPRIKPYLVNAELMLFAKNNDMDPKDHDTHLKFREFAFNYPAEFQELRLLSFQNYITVIIVGTQLGMNYLGREIISPYFSHLCFAMEKHGFIFYMGFLRLLDDINFDGTALVA